MNTFSPSETKLERIELGKNQGLFSNSRIPREEVTSRGLYYYDVRGSDFDPGSLCTAEPRVLVNHAGVLIMKEPIPMNNPDTDPHYRLRGKQNFLGYDCTLEEFVKE